MKRLRKVNVTDIVWETDGEKVFLPNRVSLALFIGQDAVEVLSDLFGFLVTECNIEEVV